MLQFDLSRTQGQLLVATISDASDTAEKFLSVPADDKPAVFAKLLGELRALLADERWKEAANVVRRTLEPASDFTTFQSLYRVFARLKPHLESRPTVKLAILGGFTTTQLAQAIELALFSMGGTVELFEADYGVYRQEILDADSASTVFSQM